MNNKLKYDCGWSEKIIEVKPCEFSKKVKINLQPAPLSSLYVTYVDIEKILKFLIVFIIIRNRWFKKKGYYFKKIP
ncbi:hypothetical protein BD780_002947 [Clostridium tetanomorphum]|uniref:Uncharacterized protein n=1 Tax=Clostridium tetanomorphum TaxID=1553 RepID=A0A923E8J5_CLOTT|nr:hypothetical protein [Clostridium tetanomorphum]KAJ53710.1 hypothetical protein CTM_00535 [Clostridium tetanomorphum DSM 665]MBC2397222.1 hypothetical protein [Clostridium tetanomorphum]MBP1862438.1 hypothetical protein [Clostridium tetanomorphum]NRS85722.1 hypothetical protein [Clostridium tetanomorphum]NRZ96269.1 hypothetical protein [Clostridium tetanomorphum]